MSDQPGMFLCERCKREFQWKPALAGKRARCKCGQRIDVPQTMPKPGQLVGEADSAVTDAPPKSAVAPSETASKSAEKQVPKSAGPVEDDGIPALGPALDEDDSPKLVSFTTDDIPGLGPEPEESALGAGKDKGADLLGDTDAAQPKLLNNDDSSDDDDWNPFESGGGSKASPLEDGTIELDLEAALPPAPTVANVTTVKGKKEKKKKQKKESLLKRGSGNAFLGIPPRIGFAIAALGISFVLGGMIYIQGFGVMFYFGIIEDEHLDQFVESLNIVFALMGLGPFLCMLAPTNWEARLFAAVTAGLVTYAALAGDFESGKPALIIIFVGLCFPLAFFGFLEKFGDSLGIGSLSQAARLLIGCVFAILIVGRLFRMVPVSNETVVKALGIVPLGITVFMMYVSFQIIRGVVAGALKR